MARLYKASRQRFIYIARHEPESIANYAQELKIDGMVLKAESRRFLSAGGRSFAINRFYRY
ncbi:hypothetical protein [Actinobacillus pleuropneumoniae]|uniref:hypothetical protein n=1 Tax=Actinobacillus pleuropneumoniae TaxID=715 RepID=UPI00201D184D|nr:hypothetical protein [Actinobacillus pleuropneumoniae]UQZ25759.1 hypothetical protein M6G44_00085 [Actinobacillus pleuropneumoniae]